MCRTGTLWSKVAEASNKIEIPISTGIAGHVATTGETLRVADAYDCPYFNKNVDLRSGYRTRSVICMAVRSRKDEIISVVQVCSLEMR